MKIFFILANATMKFLLLTLTRWKVEGKENVPREGPLIVVANHLSMVDPPLLGASIPRRITFMAKEELFSSWFSKMVVENYGSFAIKRGKLDKYAIKHALTVLENGGVLGMFPEGKRSKNGKLQMAEGGVSLIAHYSQAPILPVGISGTDDVKGPGVILRRPQIIVNIGRPFLLPQIGEKNSRKRLTAYSDFIMDRIAALLPERYISQRGISFQDQTGYEN